MGRQLHVVLFPIMAHGHMIPTLDMARLFISRGLRTTILATSSFSDPIRLARQSGLDVGLVDVRFPPAGSPLPPDIASLDQASSPQLLTQFIDAMFMLQDPVEELLRHLDANCLISDMFLPWTVDSAAKLGIPRLVFHGTNCFSLCVVEQMRKHKPFKEVQSDTDVFVVPDLPHRLTFSRTQVPLHERDESESEFKELMEQMMDSANRSYGVVVNSFYELEPEYADFSNNVLGRREWHIGPLSLAKKEESGSKALRGKKSAIDEHECLAWLDFKKPNSVVYVCFGSMATFSKAQLHEMAAGLEASGHNFIWAVRKSRNQENDDDLLPEGFEERVKGKGLIIKGWAPQVMILDHPAVGAFVTHCGWNSTLEGICAGVPMVTWPVFAEQFYNEKLVTEVLKIGVSVGNKKWQRTESEGVGREAMAKAVKGVMEGEGGVEMRRKAKKYKEMAIKAVEEGGSSYNNLDSLIQELSVYKKAT